MPTLAGRPTEVFVHSFEYDELDRLTVVEDPLLHVTTHTYDGRHNRILTVDAADNVSRVEYDGLSRPVRFERDMTDTGQGGGIADEFGIDDVTVEVYKSGDPVSGPAFRTTTTANGGRYVLGKIEDFDRLDRRRVVLIEITLVLAGVVFMMVLGVNDATRFTFGEKLVVARDKDTDLIASYSQLATEF